MLSNSSFHIPEMTNTSALPKPDELAVTPPNNLEWHLQPDKFIEKDEPR